MTLGTSPPLSGLLFLPHPPCRCQVSCPLASDIGWPGTSQDLWGAWWASEPPRGQHWVALMGLRLDLPLRSDTLG